MGASQMWPGWDTVRTIGSGGFGKVYEIQKTDSTGSYRSALKVISIPKSADEYREYADNGYDDKSITAIFKSLVDDIVSEFKMMSQFKGTSNIVSYEDHMIVPHGDGRGWDILIRMELLTSLPDYINQYGLTEGQVIQLGQNICRALELCGQKEIIHRDIKPQNIFVNEFGDFKLGDFGIARTMDHTTKATKTGTYSYMAPEVYRGMPYGASVDIYSLGLVLYWLLNERRLPFVPMPPDMPTAAQNNEAQSRRLGGDTIPDPKYGSSALKAVVLTACSFDAAQRFTSPEAFVAALNECSGGQNKVLNAVAKANGPIGMGDPPYRWWIKCPSCDALIEQYADAPEITFCGKCGGRIGPSTDDSGEETEGSGGTDITWEDPAPNDPGPSDGYPKGGKEPTPPLTGAGTPGKKAKRWTVKRIAIIAAITIAVSIIAEVLGSFIGGQMSPSGRGQIDKTYNTAAPSDSGNESQALNRRYIDYTKGTFDGTTYVNEWANLKFVIPEGYYEAADDFYNEVESSPNIDCGLYLINQNNYTCCIRFEKLSVASVTAKMYLDACINATISQYEELGISASSSHEYGQFALGLPFTYGQLELVANGVTLVQSIYVKEYGDIVCCIAVTGISQESNDQLVSEFARYDGYEGAFIGITDGGVYRPFVSTSEEDCARIDEINRIMNS